MRLNDEVVIEADSGAGFDFLCDRSTSFEIVNDLLQPAQCLVEIGDDGTWNASTGALAVGGRFKVSVNGQLRLKGRMIAPRMPLSVDTGATAQITIRSVLADAMYASCSPTVNVRKGTLRDVLLDAYAPLGLTEEDFVFDAATAVDLMTGKGEGSRRVDLDTIKEDQAKVSPPESIYNFVERHLNRHHLSHWDACDGRIVVGAPDDTQTPAYSLRSLTGAAGQWNNIVKAELVLDHEQVPSIIGAFGVGGGKGYAKAKVRAVLEDATLTEAGIYRPVLLIDEGIKTQGQAESRVMREMSIRSRQKDAWRVDVDGASYWNGDRLLPWGIDTVADVQCALASGPSSGSYLVTRVAIRGDADSGYTTSLDLVAKGIWRL